MDRAFTFLPSSTLADRSRRHLPQARAWAVHLPSYHLRLWLLAAGVIYLKHAHGPCIYLLPGRVSMAAVTSASLSRDSTNQGHHHRRGPLNLFRGRVFVPFRESVTLLLRFLYPDFASADIDICLLCVAHSGRNRHPGRCACTRFSGSTHVEGQELPSHDHMGCAVSVMRGVVQIGCLCQWWCRAGWTCRDCRVDLASWASVIL